MAEFVYCHSREPGEPTDVVEKIRSFAAYKKGWDSYDALTIFPEAIQRAIAALPHWRELINAHPADKVKCCVAPTSSGYVNFIFWTGDVPSRVNLDIDVTPLEFSWLCFGYNDERDGEATEADDIALELAFAALPKG